MKALTVIAVKQVVAHPSGKFFGAKLLAAKPAAGPNDKPAPFDFSLLMGPEQLSDFIAQLLGAAIAAEPTTQGALQQDEGIPQSIEASVAAVLSDDDGAPLLVLRAGQAKLAVHLSRPDAEQAATQLALRAKQSGPTNH